MSPRRILLKARVSLERVGGMDAQEEFSFALRERDPPYGLRASGSGWRQLPPRIFAPTGNAMSLPRSLPPGP